MKFEKLAALGAVGVSLGVLAIYVLIAFVARPVPTGGMDGTNAVLTWISVAVPVLAIIVVHLVYAKLLLDESRVPRN